MSDILIFILGIIGIVIMAIIVAILCIFVAIKEEIERGDDK